MLIKTLKALNFKKHEVLELTNLPENAVIGVFGVNESGKSSIGDAICFALFGQTSKFSKESLENLINWDASKCEVDLTFKIRDTPYKVTRLLNRKGTYKATLYQGKKKLSTNVTEINKKIEKLTQFDFDNFRYSFYLVQKEIDVITKKVKAGAGEDIIYNMLGLDRLNNAHKWSLEGQEKLKARREKSESELLVTRNLVSDIKTDESLVKNLSKKIRENEWEKDTLEKNIQELTEENSKTQNIFTLYQNLHDSFETLERSLFCNFHDETLNRTQLKLSSTYALLQEESKQLVKKLENAEEKYQKFQQEATVAEKLGRQLEEFFSLIEFHLHAIQKRLAFPEDKKKKTPPGENLQISREKEERRIANITKLGIALIVFSLFTCGLTIYSLFSALATSVGKNILFSSINPSTHPYIGALMWSLLIASIVFFLGSTLGIVVLRKRLKHVRNTYKNVLEQITLLKAEVDLCKKLDIRDLGALKECSNRFSDAGLQGKLESMLKEFPKLFEEKTQIADLEKHLKQRDKSTTEEVKKLKERQGKLHNVSRLIENMVKVDDLPPSEKEAVDIRDLDNTEKQVYVLIEVLQEHKADLNKFEADRPPEIDVAWKRYEGQRSKFREISEQSSLGGGTGMLNRIQMGFREENTEKLAAAIKEEKEHFFATLPNPKDLQKEVDNGKTELDKGKERSKEIESILNDLKQQYEKSSKELEKKEELIAKINGLNTQIKDIDYSLKVHKVSAKFFLGAIEKAKERFAPSVSKIMGRILPRITSGRYSHVQVNQSLEIKAFSTEKSDFVDISELSGGTVDQMFISLRMALSQAIMTTRVGRDAQQFLFFDEPMMSFDEERANLFFDLLSDYNPSFVQVFLVSPTNYDDDHFDLIINTKLENKKLIYVGDESFKTKKRVKNSEESETDDSEVDESEEDNDSEVDDLRIEYDEDMP